MVEIQLEVLLDRDSAGRGVATRDPTSKPAPRLFLGRSREQNVWAMRRELEPGLARELEQLCAAEARIASPSERQSPACRARVLGSDREPERATEPGVPRARARASLGIAARLAARLYGENWHVS